MTTIMLANDEHEQRALRIEKQEDGRAKLSVVDAGEESETIFIEPERIAEVAAALSALAPEEREPRAAGARFFKSDPHDEARII